MESVNSIYSNISIDTPTAIINDRTFDLRNWEEKIQSNKLYKIAKACNMYMIPNVLCPWGCNEFIFRCGFVSIDIVFQRFLRKVSLTMINSVDTMKYVLHCRDDYLRFNDDYECLLLNKDNWKVMPSVCIKSDNGAQIMTCKDHNMGCPKCMIHPPRQPNHILPSKFSDQICHAVVKPRTVTTLKASKYSNTYQMHEQRGNFNGIDTCSLTQYRNFKLLSFLLQENELRSIKGRADINALLIQFAHEKDLYPEIVVNCQKLVNKMTLVLNKLSYGASYVPVDVAIEMGLDKSRDVYWDAQEPIQKKQMTPSFPSTLYPVQNCNEYGCTPYSLISFWDRSRNPKNTSMLWLLSGILLRVKEIWYLTYKMPLYQSKWNGWLLTYLTKQVLHHYTTKTKKGDPFLFVYIQTQ